LWWESGVVVVVVCVECTIGGCTVFATRLLSWPSSDSSDSRTAAPFLFRPTTTATTSHFLLRSCSFAAAAAALFLLVVLFRSAIVFFLPPSFGEWQRQLHFIWCPFSSDVQTRGHFTPCCASTHTQINSGGIGEERAASNSWCCITILSEQTLSLLYKVRILPPRNS
jgi:hypothetical protein